MRWPKFLGGPCEDVDHLTKTRDRAKKRADTADESFIEALTRLDRAMAVVADDDGRN